MPRTEREKKYFRRSFQFSIVTIKKISPPVETWTLIIWTFSKAFKLRISTEKILSISLKLNFTSNTWGCHGSKRYLGIGALLKTSNHEEEGKIILQNIFLFHHGHIFIWYPLADFEFGEIHCRKIKNSIFSQYFGRIMMKILGKTTLGK